MHVHVVIAVQLADPSTNVSFPMNQSDNNNSVLIPKEVTKQAQTGNYIIIAIVYIVRT